MIDDTQEQDVWTVFPNCGEAKLWIGRDDRLANALRLYHPSSFIGRLVTTIIRGCPELLSRYLFTARRRDADRAELTVLRDHIRRTLGCPTASVSFSAGTAGPHRKLTAQVTQDHHVVAYVKIGAGDTVSSLLTHEARTLEWLHSLPIGSAAFPTVLTTDVHCDRTFLYLSAPAASGSAHRSELCDRELSFLAELGTSHQTTCSSTEYWTRIGFRRFLERIARFDRNAVDLLRAAAAWVDAVFQDTGMRLSPSHGDYAPWNTMVLPDGSLYVFDWEYGQDQAPLCQDLLHRLLMPARLVQHASPREAVARLLQAFHDRPAALLMERMGVAFRQFTAYVSLYWIALAMRESAAERGPSEYVFDCLRETLKTIGQPKLRRHVLVAAYACDPEEGSEPGVGWHMCRTIADVADAWVITRANNRQRIEAALRANPIAHLHFVYTDLPRWASFWKRKQRGVRLYYYLWQWKAWWTARSLGRRISFDAAHHVTFVNDWLFTFLALLPYPYVWGPIGSHPKAPRALTASWTAYAFDRLRYAFQAAVRGMDPLFWLSAARATVIVGINRSVAARWPFSLLASEKFVAHPAIGMEPLPHAPPERRDAQSSFRVLAMGRLVPIKAFHLAIEAFAQFSSTHPSATMVVVGRGPERRRLERLAETLEVSHRLSFVDWLPRTSALEEMRKSDVFLFPSFEGGGMVVLEALAHGLPVVCLRYGGPGEIVSDACGRPVALKTRQETVRALAAALNELCENPLARAAMAGEARRVTDRCLWSSRRNVVGQWYDICSQSVVHDTTGASMNPGKQAA